MFAKTFKLLPMETQEIVISKNTLETVQFGVDLLFCPIIDGVPFVVLNGIISSIGLNYNTAIDNVKAHSRFGKHTIQIQIGKPEKNKNRHAVRRVSLEKNDQKEVYFIENTPEWGVFIEQIRGYKYTLLPIHKVAGWLYSIQLGKVKPEIQPRLEKYQDECDDVLFQHFFGSAVQRKNLLFEKARIKLDRKAVLKRLEKNQDYVIYVSLCAEEMRLGTQMNNADKVIVSTQLTMWDKQD
jgi:hypothetical protein